MEWLRVEDGVSYLRLGELQMPGLVAVGERDKVTATANCLTMGKAN